MQMASDFAMRRISHFSAMAVPIGIGLWIAPPMSAQVPAPAVFEVASVKPSGPKSVRLEDGGPGSDDPERFSYTRARLGDLVYMAYGLKYEEQISGPSWIEAEEYEYDVAAKIPSKATKEQFREMLRNLLAERFQLKVHHETKQFPVFDLVIEKNGPKLKESVEELSAATPPSASARADRDRDGFPILPAGRPGFVASYGPEPHSHWTAREQPISALAGFLSGQSATGRNVIDKTGLTGKYDFTLEYDFQIEDNPGLSIFDAVRRQLGLRLVDSKALFDVIVVDYAEKVPTEN
jgi:uncharacterized protein (TIGR03435 family)